MTDLVHYMHHTVGGQDVPGSDAGTVGHHHLDIAAYIALQQNRQDSLPEVKLGKTLSLRLFGVCF